MTQDTCSPHRQAWFACWRCECSILAETPSRIPARCPQHRASELIWGYGRPSEVVDLDADIPLGRTSAETHPHLGAANARLQQAVLAFDAETDGVARADRRISIADARAAYLIGYGLPIDSIDSLGHGPSLP